MATENMLSSRTSSNNKVPVLLDGTFFKIEKIDGDKVVAKCLKCPGNKTYSGLMSATTNFLTHLKVTSTLCSLATLNCLAQVYHRVCVCICGDNGHRACASCKLEEERTFTLNNGIIDSKG